MTALLKLYEQKSFGEGKSKAAHIRRAGRTGGILHSGKPGDVIEMGRGRAYHVADDGSIRLHVAERASAASVKATRARKAPRCRAPWMRHDWLEDVCARCGEGRNPAADQTVRRAV